MGMADSLFQKWLPHPRKNTRAKRSEKDRLQVLLDSAPGEYFAWSRDNDDFLYSPGFPRLFGQDTIASYNTLQESLEPFDAAAFETIFAQYKKDPRPCELIVETLNGRSLELLFRWGESSQYRHHVIWGRDITKKQKDHKTTQSEIETKTQDIQKYTQILDALPQPIWIRNKDGALTWCNKAYGALFEKNTEEILDAQKNILIKPKDHKSKISSQDIAKTALQTGEVQSIEGRGVINGQSHTFQLQEKPYTQHEITIGICENITWLDEVEANTERTISTYHTIFSSLQTAVALYTPDQHLEFYNSGFSQLWQLDESWLNQKPKLGDVLEKLRETRRLPEQADFRSYKQEWLDMFTKLIDPHSDMLVLPDGTVIRSQVIPHPSGGLGHIFEDVTSNLELESSYNTLMAVQKETIDNLTDGIIVYGSDGRVRLWNHTFLSLWNLNPEDLEGTPHISQLFERVKDFFEENAWKARKKFVMALFENRREESGTFKREDQKTIRFSSVLLPDGGTLMTYTDVTDSVRFEEALREKNTALETAEQLKTDFLAKISYQLRTPLSAIMGFNDILDREYFGPLNEKQKEYTSGMRDAGQNLKNLIDDILDLTSLEAGIICLETAQTSVLDMLNTITENTKDWADSKQIRVDLTCPKNIGKLTIDEKRIKHAITHLIRNAITVTPEKGSIAITAKKSKGFVNISIKDTGKGIAQSELDKIFQPFKQDEDIKGGAGLGLTLVKNITELHNGTVNIESAEHKGTNITLSFPL